MSNPVKTQREIHLELIETHLLNLPDRISALKSLGLINLNLIAEDILLPLLAEAYDLPDLENANKINSQTPGIDLISPSTRIAFQITSTDTLSKFKKQ